MIKATAKTINAFDYTMLFHAFGNGELKHIQLICLFFAAINLFGVFYTCKIINLLDLIVVL